MKKLVSFLYGLARLLNDTNKVSSGSLKKIGRRAKNKWTGRKFIKKLW